MTEAKPAPRRGRGRPSEPVVSRRAAVDVAVQIIDEEGLDALSVRALGRRLGVTGASLYHHFNDKDEILRDVVRHILSDVRMPDAADAASWQSNTILSAMAYHDAFREHPNAAPLLMTRPWRSFAHNVVNESVQVLADAGVPVRLHMTILRASEMIAFAATVFAEYADNAGFGEVDERFDALRAAIAADTMTPSESLEATLRAVVTGFSVSVAMDGITRV